MEPVSRRARALAFALSRTLRPYADRAATRGRDLRILRSAADAPGRLALPFRHHDHAVIRGDARGHWINAPGADQGRGVILYLHGGGFVLGSVRSHRNLVKRLSAASGLASFFVDYRLAPEHPFPAAPDDGLAAYRLLLHDGFSPARIVLAGDSVGGSLIGALLHDIERLGLPMPAGVLMMSPALDVTASRALQRDAVERDPMLPPRFGLRCAEAYLNGQPPTDPRIAVLDQDMRNWPPVLIQVGGTECMRGDAEALAEALTRDDVDHRLEVWPGQVHVFQAFAALLPEARQAIVGAGRFLRARTESGGAEGADRWGRVS